MRYTTILFDADRTLFDFDRAEDQALKKSLEAHKHPYSEKIKQLYAQINESLWRALERGEITKEYLFCQRFARLFEQLGIEEDGAAFNEEYLNHLASGSYLIDGALDLCRALAPHCRLYILTNGIGRVQKQRLHQSELAPYIQDIFVSEVIGSEKPSPSYFRYVQEHIPHWDTSGTLMVGDSLTSDIEGAILAKIDCCWFNPSHNFYTLSAPCTYEIQKLSELLPIIFGK